MFRRRVIGSINISNKVDITCGSKTYNGETQVATNITVTFKGNTLTEGVDYIVTENNGGVNVGSYVVKIKGIKKYSGEEQGTFSITKVTPTVTAPTPINNLVYNGSAQALINAGSTNFGTLKYSLDNSTYSTSIPSGTNATSYTIYYKVDGDSNVNNVAAQSVSNSIAKVTPTVTAPTPKVLTYNGSAQELINAGSTNYGTMQYKVSSDSWGTSIPTRTRGGSYTVYYKVVGDSNINDVASASTQCSINEKPVTATVTLSQSTYTYNGSECQPTPTVKDGTTVIDPSEYTVTYSNNINAGTATVTIYDVVGGDYYVEGSATFTINKADTTYTAPTANNRTYDGTSKALLNAGSVTGGTLYYSSDNSTWGTSIPSGTNATSYITYWKITGDSNHNDKASASISTTISKASGSVTNVPTAKSLTYNGSSQALVNAGSGTGTMMYKLDSGSWGTEIPSGTNATSYTVYYKASASTNYNESSSGSVSVTISKASQSAPTATGASVSYGNTATATASGGGGQGSLEWSNGNTQTSVGSKTTKARWSGNGNYNESPWSNSVTLTVNGSHAGHEFVDLGLPSGTKWATMNVGASSITDYGNYYMYGKGVAQYASTSGDSYYSGIEDPLATSADTATQVWGGSWHMPTKAQFEELTANTTYEWVTDYKGSGINGGTFTATNGVVLFFPGAGIGYNGSLVSVGSYGQYWGSSPSGSDKAYTLYFYNGFKYVGGSKREYGYSVRPVVG